MDVTTGQRKYGGPPPDSIYLGVQPGTETEVIIGKIPRDWYEAELLALFEKAEMMAMQEEEEESGVRCSTTTKEAGAPPPEVRAGGYSQKGGTFGTTNRLKRWQRGSCTTAERPWFSWSSGSRGQCRRQEKGRWVQLA